MYIEVDCYCFSSWWGALHRETTTTRLSHITQMQRTQSYRTVPVNSVTCAARNHTHLLPWRLLSGQARASPARRSTPVTGVSRHRRRSSRSCPSASSVSPTRRGLRTNPPAPRRGWPPQVTRPPLPPRKVRANTQTEDSQAVKTNAVTSDSWEPHTQTPSAGKAYITVAQLWRSALRSLEKSDFQSIPPSRGRCERVDSDPAAVAHANTN